MIKRQAPSIFNDIVGPTMVGPSSSHTCGPSRIGYLSQQLLNERLKKATIEFARDGAYTLMYKGQRSDMGFVNGLLGRRPEDVRLRDAFAEAEKENVEIEFVISDFAPVVPNIAVITLEGINGERVVVRSDSTGGGTVKLMAIDGFEVSIVGDCYELLLFTSGGQEENVRILQQVLCARPEENEGTSISLKEGKGLINIKSGTQWPQELLEEIQHIPGIDMIRTVNPVLVVPSKRNAQLPFHSAEEMLQMANATGLPLWELAIRYEMARSGWERQRVLDYMDYVVETMEHSAIEGLHGKLDMKGIIGPTAGKVESYLSSNSNALDMGVINTASTWAMATMEYSSAMGVVLCAPTGGSAGVFPGAVLGTMTYLNRSKEEKIKAMLVTSILGIVMSKDHNYSAELYGCQVEPGAASAMAAGGLVWVMGGTPEQSCQAASFALQNILGTICDPVAGLVQIPCINRNAMSAANAVLAANMVMGGFDPLIPLDQAAETLFRVGKQLPSELRCTCKGGLCVTPCGQQLAKEQETRDNKR